jgi:hypoxanthine phosphoribosyltransferase
LITDYSLKLLISEDEIKAKVLEIGKILNKLYKEQELTILIVMKGAICFAADLIRRLELKLTLECIRCSSYGMNGTRRSEVQITGLDQVDLKDKNILIIDDIFDSGYTMSKLVENIEQLEVRSVRTMVLLNKNIPRETTFNPDFSLFEIENSFVVGYGLDYKELYRGLPGIFTIENI